jgi:2-polyprenyl-3-methyl-5-hydroxy-6-metoxy-1,4-benzoquinol methylase
MKSQDFDAYANFKYFNTNVAATWDRAFTEALRYFNKPQEDIALLDYGCGDGKYFSHLVEKHGLVAKNIYGVEVAARRVERCREIGWSNVSLLDSKDSLPYAHGSFDIVNMMEVIEHIPFNQGRKLLNDLRCLLRPGGVLLISTPNYPIKRFYDLSDVFIHQKWGRVLDDPTHVAHYSDNKLRNLLKEYFFRVEPYPFKQGFLYRYFPRPIFLHKLFFLCQVPV